MRKTATSIHLRMCTEYKYTQLTTKIKKKSSVCFLSHAYRSKTNAGTLAQHNASVICKTVLLLLGQLTEITVLVLNQISVWGSVRLNTDIFPSTHPSPSLRLFQLS